MVPQYFTLNLANKLNQTTGLHRLANTMTRMLPKAELPTLSYLDPQEDCCFCLFLFSWTAVVCVAVLSVKGTGRESEWWEGRWSEGGRGERERKRGCREAGGRGREGGKGERDTGWERVMQCIISRVLNTWTLPLQPSIPGLFLMSLFFSLFFPACF